MAITVDDSQHLWPTVAEISDLLRGSKTAAEPSVPRRIYVQGVQWSMLTYSPKMWILQLSITKEHGFIMLYSDLTTKKYRGSIGKCQDRGVWTPRRWVYGATLGGFTAAAWVLAIYSNHQKNPEDKSSPTKVVTEVHKWMTFLSCWGLPYVTIFEWMSYPFKMNLFDGHLRVVSVVIDTTFCSSLTISGISNPWG